MAELFKHSLRVVVASLALLLLTAACSAAPEPTAAPLPTATRAPAPAIPIFDSTAPTATPQPGATPTARPTPIPTVAPATPAPKVARLEHWRWATSALGDVSAIPDPMVGTGAAAGDTNRHIYDEIVSYEGADVQAKPILAASWEFLTPTHLRIKVRQGLKFHNGDPLTAEDLHYNLESRRTDAVRGAVGTFAPVAEFKVVDPYTLDVLTKYEFGPLIYATLGTQGVPKAYRERLGPEGFADKPVGSGPYKFVSRTIGQKVELEANKEYWRGPVFPLRMTAYLIREESTRAAAVLAGTMDGAFLVPIEEIKRINSDPKLEAIELIGVQHIGTIINFAEPPFSDINLRKAINLATDKGAIVNDVLDGHGLIVAATSMPGQLGYDEKRKPIPYDPAAARQLLKDTGYAGLSFEFLTVSGSFLKDTEIAELNMAKWLDVGLKPQLKIVTRAGWGVLQNNLKYEVASTRRWTRRWEMDAVAPDYFLNPGRDSKKALKDISPLGQHLQKLWEAQRSTVDPAKRDEIFRQMDDYAYANYLMVFTHGTNEIHAVNRAMQWRPYPFGAGVSSLLWHDGWGIVGLPPTKTRFEK